DKVVFDHENEMHKKLSEKFVDVNRVGVTHVTQEDGSTMECVVFSDELLGLLADARSEEDKTNGRFLCKPVHQGRVVFDNDDKREEVQSSMLVEVPVEYPVNGGEE
ncbi:hypothetical protein PFISCL1PPCAC_7056, partial [Pristionchus fissidentatus]